MSALDRINLDPALSVAGVGAVLALLAAGVVVWRRRRQPQQATHGLAAWQAALTVFTLFLTLDLVVFGAFTRLTDSGLGCPDWPGCYGESSPWAAHTAIQQAHSALPSGPVSPAKAWIEMVHRYLATGVGAMLTGLMAMAWWGRGRPGMLSPTWPTWSWLWVLGQGAFGAATVALKLQPIVVTGHLLGAMLGVGLLSWQVVCMAGAQGAGERASVGGSTSQAQSRVSRWGWTVLALVGIQMALGAWVSSNYAVLACAEFPTCQGQWWPDMDWASGFHLLRALGEDRLGGYISLAALTAIHMAHRLFAVVVVVALLWAGARLRRQPGLAREGHWLWALTAWQVLSGLSNVVLGWPLVAALAHTLGAALLVWRLVGLAARSRAFASQPAIRLVAIQRRPTTSIPPVAPTSAASS
jgi:cytochrome c oxidase assembly protein subunit 15